MLHARRHRWLSRLGAVDVVRNRRIRPDHPAGIARQCPMQHERAIVGDFRAFLSPAERVANRLRRSTAEIVYYLFVRGGRGDWHWHDLMPRWKTEGIDVRAL
jgi:hypothetical protein